MQNFQQFITEAMTEAGYSDAQVTDAITKIANHEKLGSKLNGILKTATEDYNAQLGRVTQLQTENQQYKNWYEQQAKPAFEAQKTQLESALAEIARLKNGGAPPAFDESRYMTREDIAKVIQDNANNQAQLLKTTGRLASKHAATYKEELDFDAIDKIAGEKRIPLEAAYEEYIRPRKEQAEKDDRAAWEKRVREEAILDARTKVGLPSDPAPAAQSYLFQRPGSNSKPATDADLLAVWNGAAKNAA